MLGFQLGVDGVEPWLQCLELRIDGVEPWLQCLELRVDGVEPGLQCLELRIDGVEPGFQCLEPRVDGVEPGFQPLEPCLELGVHGLDVQTQGLERVVEVPLGHHVVGQFFAEGTSHAFGQGTFESGYLQPICESQGVYHGRVHRRCRVGGA